MAGYRTLVGILMLAGIGLSQVDSIPYCDSLTNICYQSYTNSANISYRIALPSVTSAPADIIIQIVAPVTVGWAALAFGGTMVWNPLTTGWANGAGAMVSSRLALGLSLPGAYQGAEYTYLKGTGTNTTHWTLTTLCRGCTTWADSDGNIVTLNITGTAGLAWAKSTSKPANPASNISTFNFHNGFGKWQHDLAGAQSSLFDYWITNNLFGSAPTTSSILTNTSRTSPATQTITTSYLPTPTTSVVSVTKPGTVTYQTSVPTVCAGVAAAQYPGILNDGWRATKVKGGMTGTRGVILDSAGHILTVESGKGITLHTVGFDGCITDSKILIAQNNLNHGILLDINGTTLYASSMTTVWAWSYDPIKAAVVGSATIVVSGMFNGGHPTRSLVMSPAYPNLLVVSHGSDENIDIDSGNMGTARAIVKVFNMSSVPIGGYKYVTDGYNAGYGLRNEVGLTFDANNMMWGVENSSDDIQRVVNGTAIDIHIDNPADELNFIGDISKPNNAWYGYPTCFTVWKPNAITDRNFSIGDQFVVSPNSLFNDANCSISSNPARLSFAAHSAPLDAKFDANYTTLYVSLHGSFDRTPPTGYKVVAVPFQKNADGSYEPKANQSSEFGYQDVWWNQDVTTCSSTTCFRPVSIAFDRWQRMYISSDASAEGELWVLGKV